jgi:hypothetical protein
MFESKEDIKKEITERINSRFPEASDKENAIYRLKEAGKKGGSKAYFSAMRDSLRAIDGYEVREDTLSNLTQEQQKKYNSHYSFKGSCSKDQVEKYFLKNGPNCFDEKKSLKHQAAYATAGFLGSFAAYVATFGTTISNSQKEKFEAITDDRLANILAVVRGYGDDLKGLDQDEIDAVKIQKAKAVGFILDNETELQKEFSKYQIENAAANPAVVGLAITLILMMTGVGPLAALGELSGGGFDTFFKEAFSMFSAPVDLVEADVAVAAISDGVAPVGILEYVAFQNPFMAEFWKVAGLMNGETFYAAAAVGLVALDGGRKLDAWSDHQESVTKINELYAKESAFSEKEFKEKKSEIIMNHINREIESSIDSFSAGKIVDFLLSQSVVDREAVIDKLFAKTAYLNPKDEPPRCYNAVIKELMNGADVKKELTEAFMDLREKEGFSALRAQVFDGVAKDEKVAKDKAALEFLESKVENFLPLSKKYIPFKAKAESGNDSEIAEIREENSKGVSDKVDYLKSAWRNKAKKKFEGHPSQRNSPEEFQELRTFSQARL